MPYNISIYLKLRYCVEYGLILLRTTLKKIHRMVFNFPPNLRILGVIFDKKQNDSLQQLIFKPLYLKLNWRDFSETFTRGNYRLEDSFKTRILLSQALWT